MWFKLFLNYISQNVIYHLNTVCHMDVQLGFFADDSWTLNVLILLSNKYKKRAKPVTN